MKKGNNQIKKVLVGILLVFLCSSSIMPFFLFKDGDADMSTIKTLPKLQDADDLQLLHLYDFEDNVVGEDPFGTSLEVKEDPVDGSVEVANLGDEQQNHVLMHKIDRVDGKRVWVRDNVSIYGYTFHAGVISFRIYKPDTSGFEVGIGTPNEEAIHIWFWHGQIIDRTRAWYVEGDDGYIADHPLNQWFEIVIYFDLSEGWMLDIDGIRYGGEYEYGYIVEFTADVSLITYSSFASAGGSGYMRIDDISFYYYQIKKLWSFQTGLNVRSSPALGDIDGDNKLEVIVGSYDSKIYALNGEDGSVLWTYSTGNGVQSSPALGDIDGDAKLEIVVGSRDKKIYALNGEDGSILWSYQTGGYVHSSPTLGDVDEDDKLEVVVGSDDNNVYVLNGEDGSILWTYSTIARVYSSPALGDVDYDKKLEVIVGCENQKIYVLNGEDGSIVWSKDVYGLDYSSPTLGDVDLDNRLEIIIGSSFGWIYTLNGEDGSLLWEYQTYTAAKTPALGDIDGDNKLEIITGTFSGNVYALDGENGNLIWIHPGVRPIDTSPALGDVDGDDKFEVILGNHDYKIYALNGEDGSLEWKYSTKLYVESSPVLGDLDNDGKLEVVAGSSDHNVYALNPTPSGEEICWQGFSGDTNFFRTKNFNYIIDPVLKILSDISEKINQLDGLIKSNLASWRKYICRNLVCISQCLIDKLIEKRVNFEQIPCYYLYALQLNIYLIKKIANDEKISNICTEIFILCDKVKDLI